MIFKRKEKFFLTIEDSTSPPATPVPAKTEVAPAPAAPVAPPAPSKPAAPKTKGKVQDSSDIIAAAVQAAPSPVTKVAPAPKVEVPYEYFPSRRRPGPSLQGFMDMARNMGRS